MNVTLLCCSLVLRRVTSLCCITFCYFKSCYVKTLVTNTRSCFQIIFCLVSSHHVDPHHVTVKKTLVLLATKCEQLGSRYSWNSATVGPALARRWPGVGPTVNPHRAGVLILMCARFVFMFLWCGKWKCLWAEGHKRNPVSLYLDQEDADPPGLNRSRKKTKLNHLQSSIIWRKKFSNAAVHQRDLITLLFLLHSFHKDSSTWGDELFTPPSREAGGL